VSTTARESMVGECRVEGESIGPRTPNETIKQRHPSPRTQLRNARSESTKRTVSENKLLKTRQLGKVAHGGQPSETKHFRCGA
jgi:hypothetical protein